MAMRVKKGEVRSNFKYAREMMRKAEYIMQNSNSIDNWRESGEAGQVALELIASVATFSAWVEEMNRNN